MTPRVLARAFGTAIALLGIAALIERYFWRVGCLQTASASGLPEQCTDLVSYETIAVAVTPFWIFALPLVVTSALALRRRWLTLIALALVLFLNPFFDPAQSWQGWPTQQDPALSGLVPSLALIGAGSLVFVAQPGPPKRTGPASSLAGPPSALPTPAIEPVR